MHAFEGAAVPDLLHEAGGQLEAGAGIASDRVEPRLGDCEFGDAGPESRRHRDRGHGHHCRKHRTAELDLLTPAEQPIEGPRHLHAEAIRLSLPRSEWTDSGGRAHPDATAELRSALGEHLRDLQASLRRVVRVVAPDEQDLSDAEDTRGQQVAAKAEEVAVAGVQACDRRHAPSLGDVGDREARHRGPTGRVLRHQDAIREPINGVELALQPTQFGLARRVHLPQQFERHHRIVDDRPHAAKGQIRTESTSTDDCSGRNRQDLYRSSSDWAVYRSSMGTAGRPRYVELADHLEERIAAGTYRPGDRIPSLRQLKEQHRLSLTTVVDACRVLEDRGLVSSRPRSGYYVLARGSSIRDEPKAAASRMRSRRVDAPLSLRLNLGIGSPQRPTLGAAVQGPEVMAIPALNRLVSQAMRLHPTESHSYDAPPGSPQLRGAVARRAATAGCAMNPDEVVITSGAKEAVYLSIRAVTEPGDTVAIESPSYYALLEVLASLQLRVVEVPSSPTSGIDLAALGAVLDRHRISAVALVSNFSNPLGSCMSDDDKRRLVELVDAHRVPLIEDDVYGELAFDGDRPKAIKAFDRRGSVLYCASCSKTVSPGLRVGWASPGRFQSALEHLKLVVNQATATAPQLALAEFLDSGRMDRHLRRIRPAYRDQMERAIDAVDRLFPTGTRHTDPRGGHVLWVQVPGLDSLALYEDAAPLGIHVAPGPLFSAGRERFTDCLRINTGFAYTADTEHQVLTLGKLIERQLG